MKLITKFIRPLGMIIFFFIASLCIFSSVFVRDIDENSTLYKILDYTISFDNRFYDYRVRTTLNKDFRSKEIVLVKLDDYSLQKIGSWPIPRENYAKLLDKLQMYGAKVVGLDVLYPEKSVQSQDRQFIEAIKRFQQEDRRVFVGYTVLPRPQGVSKEELEQADHIISEPPLEMLNDALQTRTVPERDIHPSMLDKYTFPFTELVESEVGLGTIDNKEDLDGVFRQYHLLSNIDTIYYGSLALNSYEAWTGTKNTINIFADRSGELKLDKMKLQISPQGETKVRYIGSDPQFPEVSFYDVIARADDDKEMHALFNGKLVFVGSTATGAHDLRPSPIDSKMPGVYSHVNMAHMLIHQFFYQDNGDSVNFSLTYLILGMLILVLVTRLGNAVLDAATVIVLLVLSYYADRYYFLPKGYELKLFYCYFCFISCYSWHTFIEFYRTAREKKQIRGTFQRYVSPTVVDEMLKDPEHIKVGGTKMDITCLFSDVRDFTSISEGMSAVELAHSLNLYMGRMTDIVFETKGTLDKYIGDAIVALWGAPLPIGNHAQHAVEGAIRMMEILPFINEEFKSLGRPQFNVGIGLNSGECSVGNMGSTRIFSYTALGDNMNLGARLEGLCKYYGTQILISEFTRERLDLNVIKTRPIDNVIVKGKTHPVAIYEVLHPNHFMWNASDVLNEYLRAHELFLQKKFEEAKDIFTAILAKNEKDKPSKRLKDVCEKYINDPSLVTEDFSVTKMTEK